jgi:predicted esterase
MKKDVEALRNVPLWGFHDRYDPSIPLKKEEGAIRKLIEEWGDVQYTVTETGRHYIHEEIYAAGLLFDWFLENSRR